MIQLKRPDEPASLSANKAEWTRILVEKIAELSKLGKKDAKYTQIQKEVEAAQKHYDQKDVREALNTMTTGSFVTGKCVYCETFITSHNTSDIEHFEPKSLYPEECFKWDNLLLACPGCNRPPGKGSYDTRNNPIVNPVNDNPEEYFTYVECKIKVKPNAPDIGKGERTIECCDLKRIDLRLPRFEISNQFESLKIELKQANEKYNKLTQNAAKIERAVTILNCLRKLKALGEFGKQYAGYMRYLIHESRTIPDAITIVNAHQTDLGLSAPFVFEWNR